MNVSISVICLTYNSDIKKTLVTLNSVIAQKNCCFEVIIADDGSENNNINIIEQYFKSNNFLNYKIRANEVNQGIIGNYLSAIELAKGKYIKYISPGDYLYDEFTLKKCVDFMKKYNAELAFGRALYYSYNDEKLVVLNKQDPVNIEIYEPGAIDYNFNKVLKHLVLWQDCILGAAVIADRKVFEVYLGEIVGKVKYIEDNTILPLATIDNRRIYYLKDYILWYECDSGISTNSNRGFKTKIELDFLNCYNYLRHKAPGHIYIELAYLKQKFLVKNSKLMLFCIKRILDVFFGRYIYKQNNKKKMGKFTMGTYDKANFFKWQ